jgi:hypothetical protein
LFRPDSQAEDVKNVFHCYAKGGLEIQQLIESFVSTHSVQERHDASSQFEVRCAAVGDQDASMGLVLLESGQMELFIVAAIVSEEAPVVLKRKLQLISITLAQILRIPRGQDIKPVWT